MAGDVTYMNSVSLQAAISAASQAVSGMTPTEAAAALGGTIQETNGGTQIITFPMTSVTGGQPVTVEAQYASQLWEYWKTVGAATGTTAIGAAAGAAVSWAQGVLIGTGEGLAAGGLLTLSVPTAVAMAAPVLGVGLGAALYETNPTLWNNISNGLATFCIKGTQTIAAIFDGTKLMLPEEFVETLKDNFDEYVIPEPQYPDYANVYTVESYSPVSSLAGFLGMLDPRVQISASAQNKISEFFSTYGNYPGTTTVCTRIANKTVSPGYGCYTVDAYTNLNVGDEVRAGVAFRGYSLTTYIDKGVMTSASISSISRHPYIGERTYTTGGGDFTEVSSINAGSGEADYPVGTFQWTGNVPDIGSITPSPVYDPSTGNSNPYFPVSPVIGDEPGTTVDPEEYPNPITPITPEIAPAIDPYITPVVNPEIQIPDSTEITFPDPDELVNPGVAEDPVYIPTPNLDPSIDPSAVPSTEPENITQPDTPQNTGTSPDIIFPVPNVPFPSIVPAGSDTPVPSGNPGFIQVYNPTPSEFVAFGRWLWVTYADATLDTIWNNPFDGVIGAHELYATPSKDGYSTIRSGFLDSGISSIIVRQRYTQINCGSILIPEYWGNYLDYSPYSRAYIYLPFIGIMDIDVDDIVGHAVNVLYHVDSYTGSCIAQITCARDDYTNTLYQFSGDCSVEIPMAGGSQANIKAAMIAANAYQNAANISAGMSLFGGLASGLATGIGGAMMPGKGSTIGGISSGIGQAIGGIASAVSQYAYGEAQHTAAMVSQKSHVQHSGSFGGSHGAMGIKKPYIILRRPIQKVVNDYNKLYGYPAHKMVVIGDCTGYLRCREVNVQSSLATDEEKRMIEEALKSGVYVTE